MKEQKETMTNVQKIIKFSQEGKASQVKSTFDKEIANRIMSIIDNKRRDIGGSLFGN
jgi:hypothetical protein